jgi:hypothetical protein
MFIIAGEIRFDEAESFMFYPDFHMKLIVNYSWALTTSDMVV